ncbi:MAG: arginine deiminase-related protein [Bacteroidales bacterium]
MVKGLTTAGLGKPEFKLALQQHDNYINALEKCGLKVEVLQADERYPDSVFIEDTALCTKDVAIISRPGAESRLGEETEIEKVLKGFYKKIERIEFPGTVEAGDIMMVGSYFYIGLSNRTNRTGANQMINLLERYKMTGSVVELNDVLHLKTGVSYLENNVLLAAGEFVYHPAFQKFEIIPVENHEAYAANSVWLNGCVLVPEGYPSARDKIKKFGYQVIEVDLSEFQKLDGGLSCLSLRF